MNDWWRFGVIYQVYPHSFADYNNDGVGDLLGIYEKLDYLAKLNIDAIWISPFFKSPMKDFGYDISDYRDVDPRFGSLADFNKVLQKAHDLGLKVIIDLVLNHTSDQHSWFEESRQSRTGEKADWYIWSDPKEDGMPPNNWLSIFGGGAWEWEPRRQQYYYHHFLPSQPDLNFRNHEVQEELLATIRFWLEMGVDGVRLDACNNFFKDAELRNNPGRGASQEGGGAWESNPYSMQVHKHDKSLPDNIEFLNRVRSLLNEFDGAMSVAEIGDDRQVEISAEYVAGNDRLHTAYSFELLGTEFSARHIRQAVENFNAQPGNGWPAWAFSNHDSVRACSRWGGENYNTDFTKMLMALLCTLRGTTFIYQGEELALPEADVPYDRLLDPYGIAFYPKFKGRDGARTPMPWKHNEPNAGFSDREPFLPVPETHYERAASLQEQDHSSMLNFARQFLGWRKKHPAILTGDIEFINCPEPVLAFVRTHDEEKILCVFNLSQQTQVFSLNDQMRLINMNNAAPNFRDIRSSEHTDIELLGHEFFINEVITDQGYENIRASSPS